MTNKKRGTLYTGVTRDLARRIYEHKQGEIGGFTKKYGLHMLVYHEHHSLLTDAIMREKSIKAWRRQWKIELIESFNPQWNDLYKTLNG